MPPGPPILKDIDKSVIDHLHLVIAQTRKPSWIRGLPPNFGVSTAGTPKADEWRTLFTIYLPLTLISLWRGIVSGPPENRQLLVLKNTMHLVSAISIMCRHTVTKESAAEYLQAYTEYVRGFTELYPHVKAVPNMHLLFHIFDFMLLFGPVRSWWCFPFERLVGHFQDILSNHISGMLYIYVSPAPYIHFQGKWKLQSTKASYAHRIFDGGCLAQMPIQSYKRSSISTSAHIRAELIITRWLLLRAKVATRQTLIILSFPRNPLHILPSGTVHTRAPPRIQATALSCIIPWVIGPALLCLD